MLRVKSTIRSAVFLIAGVVSGLNVHAGVFTYTQRGHVDSGTDDYGFFETIGTDLTGLAYTATYTYSTPAPDSYFVDDGVSQKLYGGKVYGNTGPVSATLTINGRTLSIAGGNYGQASRNSSYSPPDFAQEAIWRSRDFTFDPTVYKLAELYQEMYGPTGSIFDSYDITTSVNATNFISPSIFSYGDFTFELQDRTTGNYLQNIHGTLVIDSVTVEGVATVPEPGSMLVFGGLAGLAAFRFRRKKAA